MKRAKTTFALAVAALAGLSAAQVGVHVGQQVWNANTIERLYQAGLYDHSNNTIRIDSFEYTADPNVKGDPTLWILSNKLKVAKAWEAAHPGFHVELLIRCTRNRKPTWQYIPETQGERDWWANFVATKAHMTGGLVGTFNEPSLQWRPTAKTAEEADRPERHAALVHELIQKMLANGDTPRILAPSVHSIVDDGNVGYGFTYAKRFFDALPEGDRQYVKPDFHLYYGYLSPVDENGIITTQAQHLRSWFDLLGQYGYSPEDCYVSEFASGWYSSKRAPTSQESAERTVHVLRTARTNGIPAAHCYLWLSESGSMSPFGHAGSLTPFGQTAKALTNIQNEGQDR